MERLPHLPGREETFARSQEWSGHELRDVVEMALRLRGKAASVVAFGGIVVISSLYELLEGLRRP